MKRILLATVLAGLSAMASAASIEGKWQTIYEDGKPRSYVQISKVGDSFVGKVVGVAEGVDNNCTVCKPAGPLIGRVILRGLKQESDNEYDGGKITDPKNGKTYSAKATVNGNTLEMRGYLGISALGRSQTWRRVK